MSTNSTYRDSDRTRERGERKVRVLDALAKGNCLSIEMVPPSRGGDLDALMRAMETIAPHNPSFVSVTDHPRGSAWADSATGPCRVALRTKPGTLGTAVALRDAFDITTVPHIIGRMQRRLDVEDLLIDLHYAGFHDIFAVMGDERYTPEALRVPDATKPTEGLGPADIFVSARGPGPANSHAESSLSSEGYCHAVDLVAHIMQLNRGEYTPPSEGRPTHFVVGVAAYPQKHFAAPNLETDIQHLIEKIQAGASFVITQMIFEARPYFELVAKLRKAGIAVPVLPGIKPLLKASSLETIPRNFFVDIPSVLIAAMSEAKSPAEERAVGIEWMIKLCQELLEGGAPGLHFFTMGKGAGTRAILDALFGTP